MTNIFLPSPFVFQPTKEGNVAQDDREKILIWITGDRYGVQIAKETLLRSAESKVGEAARTTFGRESKPPSTLEEQRARSISCVPCAED